MNFLFCSVGRRGELIRDIKKSFDFNSKIIATDNDNTAPALYFADKQYIVPKITDDNYISIILEICIKEKINAVTTLIDPEIAILAKHRSDFSMIGVEVLAPYYKTAQLCFDKYAMFEYLTKYCIPTPLTFKDISSFNNAYNDGKCSFPVFVKPRTGSGSIRARKIYNIDELATACSNEPDLIIQEFIGGIDIDADVYIDTISHKPVSIFSKRKIFNTIGGASKTISFKDDKLFDFIEKSITKFKFNGPIDIDLFYVDGIYYLIEINPRFGGAYLHASHAGVDFIKLIINNLNKIENKPVFGNYEEDILMLMFDSVVIKRKSELAF